MVPPSSDDRYDLVNFLPSRFDRKSESLALGKRRSGAAIFLEPVSKMALRILQEAPADQAAADFEERFVNAGQPFTSDSESAKPMQPSDSALHHPKALLT